MTFFINLFNVCLKKVSWTLLAASAFSLLQCIVLAEVYEENLASLSYIVEKGRILITFTDIVDILL